MKTKRIRAIEPIGNPKDGAIIARGTVAEIAEFHADRYIAQGKAELVAEKSDKKAKKE